MILEDFDLIEFVLLQVLFLHSIQNEKYLSYILIFSILIFMKKLVLNQDIKMFSCMYIRL